MAKAYFIPADDQGKCLWLSNFATKLPTYAGTVGVDAAEVAATAADNLMFSYVCDANNQIKQFALDFTAYKNGLRSGPSIGGFPNPTAMAPVPPLVAANIFGRVSALGARIKKHPGYTNDIGQDLNLIGADQTVNLGAMKPILKVTLQAGHPLVAWKKETMDSLEILVDRATGSFVFLAIDTVPDYLDTAPLPVAGASAVWKYKAIYRLHDDQIGQWSDVVSTSVMG